MVAVPDFKALYYSKNWPCRMNMNLLI